MRASRLLPCLAAAIALAAPAHAGEVVMRDDFSSRAGGWHDNHEAAGSGASVIGFYTDDGKYQMMPLEDGMFGILPVPRQPKSGAIRMQAEIFLYAGVGAGAAGMVCRAQDVKNFYAFLVNGTGGWGIARVRGGNVEVLARGPAPRQVMDGAFDGTMQVECEGDMLRLSLNGKRMGEARDAAFDHGISGLMMAGEKLGGTNAVFDDFVLEQLP